MSNEITNNHPDFAKDFIIAFVEETSKKIKNSRDAEFQRMVNEKLATIQGAENKTDAVKKLSPWFRDNWFQLTALDIVSLSDLFDLVN